MKINFLNSLINLYFTGTTKPGINLSSEKNTTDYTKEELDELETNQEDLARSKKQSIKFKNNVLDLETDFNTVTGLFRMSGTGVINSLFSGIGSSLGNKIGLMGGFGLSLGSLLISQLKGMKFLHKKFNFMSVGFHTLIRGPLHIFDSIFSTLGERGAKFSLPSVLAAGFSFFSLNRTLQGKENQNLEAPIDSVGGTLARTSIHHLDSMLSTKGKDLMEKNQLLGGFLASSLTTFGLVLPKSIKQKILPWNNLEGFVSQGGFSFIDSMFSNVGSSISTFLTSPKKILLALSGLGVGLPLVSSFLKIQNYKIPFGTMEGRLLRGMFHSFDGLAFNLGNIVSNSRFGFVGALGGVMLPFLSKGLNLNRIQIERNTIKGLITRLPFEFMSSITSNVGVKMVNLIPAPMLTIIGPALSFRLGEIFKGLNSKYDDASGLLIRNSMHLWESMLTRAAYKTGQMISNVDLGNVSSGSILSDGRWLTEDGRIVSSMAIGKQGNNCEEKNLLHIFVGMVMGCLAVLGGAKFLVNKINKNQIYIDDQPESIHENASPLPSGPLSQVQNKTEVLCLQEV